MTSESVVSAHSLQPLLSTGLVDDVHEALLDLLLAGTLAPGSTLSIEALARTLQVSPTPVREALARLEHTGLVLRLPRRGYRVAPPMSPEQMSELVDARMVLEEGAIRRAMAAEVPSLQQDLSRALEAHSAAARDLGEQTDMHDLNAVHEYFRADWHFHQVFLDHCGNRYIDRAVNGLAFSVHRMRQSLGAGAGDWPLAIKEHEAILDSVQTGDVDAAVDAMIRHLELVAARSTDM